MSRSRRKKAIYNCSFKIKHSTEAEAVEAMNDTLSNKIERPMASAYKCSVCGYFHWGKDRRK